MTKFYRHILIGIFVSISTGLLMGDNRKAYTHPESMKCQQCHLAQGEVTERNAHQLISGQEILCDSCHQNLLKVSHPSGFSPGRKLPDEFPLDWKGELTCSSCHNIHQHQNGSLKNQKAGKEFCLACHEPVFFQAMADRGLSIRNIGHSGNRLKNNASIVDVYSMQCMSCHANEGDAVEVFINSRGIVKHSSGTANHPIGMSYKDAQLRGSYRNASELSSDILLPDGKVSCVSCHNGYDRKHGALVKRDTRTALCLECHNM